MDLPGITLAAVKEQNGAAMSLGRTSTFLDVYSERDLKEGRHTEKEIQEFVDHFIMRAASCKNLPEHRNTMSCSQATPHGVTESIGGIGIDGRHMVAKMSLPLSAHPSEPGHCLP
ncbi:MAG: pyruvate formate lyase family protein [Enterocloster clostridioformis]